VLLGRQNSGLALQRRSQSLSDVQVPSLVSFYGISWVVTFPQLALRLHIRATPSPIKIEPGSSASIERLQSNRAVKLEKPCTGFPDTGLVSFCDGLFCYLVRDVFANFKWKVAGGNSFLRSQTSVPSRSVPLR
jgi:hypothetical protein